MRHVEGRRVETMEDLEEGGDYCVAKDEDGGIVCLWFCMPGFVDHKWNRIPGPAAVSENRWDIVEDADGVVTVSPSVLSWWKEAGEERRFHAFLKGGVWEVLDDTVGAVF